MAQFNKNTHQFLNDSKTLFETVMLADQYGTIVGAANPTGMAVDAFGRARVSQPLTLFDSFHRYQDNGKFATSNSATGTTLNHNSNAGLIEANIDTADTSFLYRESTKVFAYQPGKSLQVLQTFIMNPAQTGLRQRIGYFSTQNGIYLELDNDTLNFVERSYSTGSVTETKVAQANWNIDPMDGTGPSRLTLDITKAQIFFTDIEWLGLGTVRCGFVINGQYIHCHSFHHANIITTTYMTTACLPVRAEIQNTANTNANSTLKLVCSTVLSEGGYELSGKQFSVGTPISLPKDMPTANTFVPIVSIRLKSTRLDSIVLPKNISILGLGNNTRFKYKVVSGDTLALNNASWTSVANNSAVEYDLSANSYTGGQDLLQGYLGASNRATAPVTLGDSIFKYQLERNSFTSTPSIFSILATGASNGDDCLASIEWEEFT
jgi:hypothetical protein